jgi:DNA-binding transcriptional regulator LsrR (DeoR family)
LASATLYFVYDYPAQPDKSLGIQERDTLIRTRYAAGVSQADIARQFGISYQRVHQIVHGETR